MSFVAILAGTSALAIAALAVAAPLAAVRTCAAALAISITVALLALAPGCWRSARSHMQAAQRKHVVHYDTCLESLLKSFDPPASTTPERPAGPNAERASAFHHCGSKSPACSRRMPTARCGAARTSSPRYPNFVHTAPVPAVVVSQPWITRDDFRGCGSVFGVDKLLSVRALCI